MLKAFILCFISFFSVTLFAFPEMIRHGYFNCVTCHISPNGGGVINPYGRQLSKDVLSSFSSENEEKFLYNTVSLPTGVSVGGDIRFLQYYVDSLTSREAKAFVMQDDLEGAIEYKKTTIAATVGQQLNPQGPPTQNAFFSRRHYLIFTPVENFYLRAGKFRHEYGLNTADHIISIKRGLGWNENTETYNAELSWLGESFNFFITGIFGRPDDTNLDREKGIAVTASYFFLERYKVGLSYLNSTTNNFTRQVMGPFLSFAFTKNIFWLSELDLQLKDQRTSFTSGYVSYNKFDYEPWQGLHFFGTHEYTPSSKSYGVGIQFFPRPHFEFLLALMKQQIPSISESYFDYDYFVAHFYL